MLRSRFVAGMIVDMFVLLTVCVLALDQLIKTIVAQREVEAASDKLGTVSVLPGSGKSQMVAEDRWGTPEQKASRGVKAPSKAEAEQQMRDVTGSRDDGTMDPL